MSVLDQLKGFNVQPAPLEEIYANYAFLGLMREQYVKLDLPQPSWMGGKLTEMVRTIAFKRQTENEAILERLIATRKAKMTPGEQRTELDNQIEAMQKKLGLPVTPVVPVEVAVAVAVAPEAEKPLAPSTPISAVSS